MDMTDRFATAMLSSIVLGALIVDASESECGQSIRSSASGGAPGSETGVWLAAAMSLLRLLN